MAFIEGDLHDLAVDPSADQNGVVGLDLTDAWRTMGKSARLTGVTVTTIGAGPFVWPA